MRNTLSLLGVFLLALTSMSAVVPQAQQKRVIGTRVRMTAPAEFTRATLYMGFEHQGTGSSIMINEIKAPIGEIMKGLSKEGLAAGGMTLISRSEFTREGFSGAELHVSQTAGGIDFLKWMQLIGDKDRTVMIIGTYPAELDAARSDAIRDSVLTATWDSTHELDPFENLGFRVSSTKNLKLSQDAMTNMVMLTSVASGKAPSPSDAICIVGNSYRDTEIKDLEVFAKARAKQVTGLSNFEVLSEAAIKLADLQAYELVMSAIDLKAQTPMRLYQVVAEAEDRYFLIQGIISESKWEEFEPEFRQVTASFRRIEPESIDED